MKGDKISQVLIVPKNTFVWHFNVQKKISYDLKTKTVDLMGVDKETVSSHRQ